MIGSIYQAPSMCFHKLLESVAFRTTHTGDCIFHSDKGLSLPLYPSSFKLPLRALLAIPTDLPIVPERLSLSAFALAGSFHLFAFFSHLTFATQWTCFSL